LWNTKKKRTPPQRAIQNKRHGMLTSRVELPHEKQLLALKHYWSISSEVVWSPYLQSWSCSELPTTFLPAWRTVRDHSASTIMRSWWKVSKRA
jgi:hypothetical protein